MIFHTRLWIALVMLASGLLAGTASADDGFLAVDRAFQPAARRVDAAHVVVTWKIAEGYYLYRHALKFSLVDAGKARVGAVELPAGDRHRDEFFGKVETYRRALRAIVAIRGGDQPAEAAKIKITYQGCADAGLCYPPQTRVLKINPIAAGGPDPSAAPTAATPVRTAAHQAPQGALAERLAGAGWASTLALFFGLGVLLAFTPCILPMIPIVAALVVGSRASPARALGLSSAYVLAMAVAYTVFGVVAASFGANIQAALQTPAVLLGFAGVFVLLALASFGLFEIAVPGAWQERLARYGRGRGGFLGAGLMGFFAALIAGPCLAPPLVGALLYISTTGDAALGGAALFVLGLGMGLPLIAIAMFGARVLPRAGAWMDQLRILSGVVLLGVALWLATRLADPGLALAGWGLLALIYGAYLSTLDTQAPKHAGARTLVRFAVFALWLYAGCAGVGVSIGDGRPARPLAGLRAATVVTSSDAAHASPFTRISDLHALKPALAVAARAGRPAVVDFYADWCVECVRMKHTVFARSDVRAALAGVTAIQIDVTDYDAADRRLLRAFGVFGPPAILFFHANGGEARGQRVVGAMNAVGFLDRLRRINISGASAQSAENNG